MTHNERPALQTRVIRAVDHRLTTRLSGLDAGAMRTVRAVVPPKHREPDGHGVLIVFGSHSERAVTALESSGYRVVRSTPTASAARSAHTP